MSSPREWPDATTEVAAALIDAGFVARWSVPDPRPAKWVLVRRVGGPPSRAMDEADMDIECWSGQPGDSPAAAHRLAAEVHEALVQLPRTPGPISHTRITGKTDAADPVSGAPRVLIGCRVWLRPTAA